MEPVDCDDTPVICEICYQSLLFPLNNVWLRPEAFGGSVTMKLCTSCEREFWKLTSSLHAQATNLLTSKFEERLEELKAQRELELRQLKLPVV